MRRSTLLSVIFAAVIAGLVIGRYFEVETWLLAFIGVGFVIMRRPRLVAVGLLLLALALGIWRAGNFRLERADLTSRIGSRISVTGKVSDDPGTTATGGTVFKLDNLVIDGVPTGGVLPVYMQRTTLKRGWAVEAEGKLKDGFGNQPVELSYPKLTVTSREQTWLERFRQQFFVGMKTALPEPVASFGLGLLVGIRSLIPKDLQTELALVGLSHLVAVSGYNLTIIVRAAARGLDRFGRHATLAANAWLISLFVVAAGGGASIVRAAIVSGLSLLAGFYGRQFKPLVIIGVTAAATALYNPAYLTDYGWLLSFLAFFGIMVLAPAITARLKREPGVVTAMLIETCTAIFLTFPLIAYGFGQFSVVAPLANLIELPFVPAAMLTSLLAGLGGMLFPAFAGWLAWPANLLLGGMLWLVHQLAAIPGAGVTLHLSFGVMLGIYAVMALATWLLARGRTLKPRESLQSGLIYAKISK